MKSKYLYLSRRNLLTLLSKLDRARAGEATACTLVKHATGSPPGFEQSYKVVYVKAVEDDVYYATRAPGEVHQDDDPNSVTKELK